MCCQVTNTMGFSAGISTMQDFFSKALYKIKSNNRSNLEKKNPRTTSFSHIKINRIFPSYKNKYKFNEVGPPYPRYHQQFNRGWFNQ